MHPFILLILAVGGVLLYSWYRQASSEQQRKFRSRGLIYGVVAIVAIGLLTGRLSPLIAAAAAGVPVLYRLFGLYRSAQTVGNLFKSARGPTAGRHSDVSTRFLRMSLDHDSGEMRGTILDGAHHGRALEDLQFDDLVELLGAYRREDPQSAALLEAYLDRNQGDSWRARAGEAGGGATPASDDGQMTREQACRILGVGEDASRKEIVETHRRLMQKLHPDRGGSDYLAAKINQAKDLLTADA